MSVVTQPNGPAQTAIAKPPSRAVKSVEVMPGVNNLMDSERFDQLYRVAKMMSFVAPKHLRETSKGQALPPEQVIGNCFRVANQALRWGMDPFAVMDETYVVHGKLGYQGKLVAGVVNTRADLLAPDGETKGRLLYEHSGAGDGRRIIVSGLMRGEHKPRTVDLTVGQGKTDNEMWKKDPDQKLIYSGVIKWARAHCPEIILGIVTEDDIERMRSAGHLSADVGESLVHRSALNDTFDPNAEPQKLADETAGDGNAHGLDQSGEGSQTTQTSTPADQSTDDGHLSQLAIAYKTKIEVAHQKKDRLGNLNAQQGIKADKNLTDGEREWLVGLSNEVAKELKGSK